MAKNAKEQARIQQMGGANTKRAPQKMGGSGSKTARKSAGKR
jgi:hypothetical protein